MAAKNNAPKVAIVHDWLTNMGGAEKTVLSLAKAFPDAPIYTSVFDPEHCPAFKHLDVRTTPLQNLPKFLRNKHQLFSILRPYAFHQLDLSEFDVVISSASAEAKHANAPNGTHICYCHTPTRYYWSHYEEYRKSPGFGALNPLVKLVLPKFVKKMRQLDLQAAKKVDYFLANSNEVKSRITTYYQRDAEVVFPPVATARFAPKKNLKKQDYYLIVGRQIPYKRFDLAIQACTKLHKKLIVIGQGSEHEHLKKMAGPTIEFKQINDDQKIVEYFQKAKAFIFPAHEDFGIVPIEAMSAGTPVIAYKNGGALDYVTEKTGVFFEEQTTESLLKAIDKFETMQFNNKEISDYAEAFSEARFIKQVQDFVTNVPQE